MKTIIIMAVAVSVLLLWNASKNDTIRTHYSDCVRSQMTATGYKGAYVDAWRDFEGVCNN